MAFNPNDHMMKLKGKDYLQVMWRLVWFREDKPNWSLDSTILQMDENHAVFKAVVLDENGQQKSVGHGSESKRDFGDFIEKAETKAIGRALAMLGYGTQFAPDLDEGERIVDSPVPVPEDAIQPGEKLEPKWDVRTAGSRFCKYEKITGADFESIRKTLIARGKLEDKKLDELTPIDFDNVCRAVKDELPKYKARATA